MDNNKYSLEEELIKLRQNFDSKLMEKFPPTVMNYNSDTILDGVNDNMVALSARSADDKKWFQFFNK